MARFSTSDDKIAENAPWEGLLALELMLMLLAIGGIGLLCYAWKKYKKFEKRLENLRRTDQYYATTTSNPNLATAPIFIPPLKEYEVQSLEMYVPQEEDDLGEINLGLSLDEGITKSGMRHSMRGGSFRGKSDSGSGVVAAINPIFEPANARK